MASQETPRKRTSRSTRADDGAGARDAGAAGTTSPGSGSGPRTTSPNAAVALAAQALAEATSVLGEALRSATSDAVGAVEDDLAKTLRSAAANVEDVAARFTRRSGRSDRTRADLLAAAVAMFASRGYGATSVEDVAAAAGYTKGAVYSRFPSKSDLFLAIFRDHLDRGPDNPGPLDVPSEAQYGEDHLAALHASRADPRLTLSSELVTFGLRHPEHRAEAGELYSRLLDESIDSLMTEEARLAGEAGEPRPAGTAEERQDARERLLVSSAVTHHLSILTTLGVEGVDDDTWLRLVRAAWPVQGPRSGSGQGGRPTGDGTHGTDESR
ncbi:transcriptional regulator [Sanguibacter keddieii DSM 10542]|uniref:Transcriptional regulator n=1 Tax=Sanguibacter keddieii (strain ATCC 51767 / DSM 10542 / NCFB 3025 / ST-74) TaxID=446469 RepID=D1BBH9_SANKS|nr:TetR/AcrR family transcriptional regulator [Sanguibacter keddieii]ACZ22750.1 transcriptional regulator [Sanguibacter keddieii DSM 10542]